MEWERRGYMKTKNQTMTGVNEYLCICLFLRLGPGSTEPLLKNVSYGASLHTQQILFGATHMVREPLKASYVEDCNLFAKTDYKRSRWTRAPLSGCQGIELKSRTHCKRWKYFDWLFLAANF